MRKIETTVRDNMTFIRKNETKDFLIEPISKQDEQLEILTAGAELERHGCPELSEEQLHLKDDPEVLLERGIRMRHGIGVREKRMADGSLSSLQQSSGIL
jgi:hypothetical protein